MNYMPKVLEMLGVERNIPFKIVDDIHNPYLFDDEYNLLDMEYCERNGLIGYLLLEELEIEKLPWKPKEDDEYYIVCENGNIINCRWSSRNTNSFYRYNAGNCFKTKEEITPEIKQQILQEMKGKYENDI